MRHDGFFRFASTLPQRGGKTSRQRGVTLVDFMVGMAVGLLIILAAVASLLTVRGSSRTMTDSTALEQQATLAMLQIGRQLSQTGAYNAFTVGTHPDTGVPASADTSPLDFNPGDSAAIQFDTRPIGVAADDSLAKIPLSGITIFGVDGTSTAPDTLYISHALFNDGSPSANCNNATSPRLDSSGGDPLVAQYGSAARAVSVFTVDPSINSLTCGSDFGPSPIAANVADMRLSYLSMDASGNVTYYANAAAVNAVTNTTWNTINGVQVCLEMVGDPTQAGEQTLNPDCQGKTKTFSDGRLRRIVRNTFYLRNPLQAS